jgi:prevent-host-death family protein
LSYPVRKEDEFIGKREFRAKMPDIIYRARQKGSRVFITDRGKPDAVCMPIEEYEALMELIEDMHDKNLVMTVSRSRREIERGETVGLEELKKSLGLE